MHPNYPFLSQMRGQLLIGALLVFILAELFIKGVTNQRLNEDNEDRGTLWRIYLSYALAFVLLHFIRTLDPWHLFLPGQAFFVGFVFIVIGLILRFTALWQLKQSFTLQVGIQEDHELVTTGLYHWLRHPAYFGSYLAMFGFGLIFQDVIGILVVMLILFWAYHKRIEVEEEVLHKHFGDAYAAYCQQTRWRLIPLVY